MNSFNERTLINRIYYFALILFSITSVGITGFMLIEGWGLLDSLYMTVITISTVGFKEVHDLSMGGKLFTTILIVFSFGIFAYAVTSLSAYFLGGEYGRYLKHYRKIKALKDMQNHVIVCGYGRVGKQVTEDLMNYGESIVAIDNAFPEQMHSDSKVFYLEGDSTREDVLMQAELHEAKAIITCLPKDADNLYIVLTAREKNPSIKIICRAIHNDAVKKLRQAGANNVILPDSIGGSHLASLIVNPDTMEFYDFLRIHGYDGNIVSVSFEQLPVDDQKLNLADYQCIERSGVTLIGMKTETGEYRVNPDKQTILRPGMKLFVLGNSAQISRLSEQLIV